MFDILLIGNNNSPSESILLPDSLQLCKIALKLQIFVIRLMNSLNIVFNKYDFTVCKTAQWVEISSERTTYDF